MTKERVKGEKKEKRGFPEDVIIEADLLISVRRKSESALKSGRARIALIPNMNRVHVDRSMRQRPAKGSEAKMIQ